jgi:hypothetical protein
MAEISKEDWKKLTEELHSMSDQLKDAKHQLNMLADRADRAEKFHDKVEPNMWFVTGAKWFVGAFSLTILVGIISFAYSFGSLNSDVKHYASAIAKLEQSNERLVELIIDRFPSKAHGQYLREGKIIKVSKDEITIETAEPEKKQLSFKLTPETMIFLLDKPANPTDLKKGMHVRVTEEDGNTKQIHSVAH